MNRIRHVVAVIPARDEADTIDATIDSVERARRQLPTSVTSSCVIVVDASSDETGAVIGRRNGTGGRSTSSIVVRTAHGCVGAARSVGCRVALGGSLHRPRHVWLAHTDADTVVPGYWLTAQLDLAERGAAAVAGTVELDGDADGTLRAEFEATYEVASDGTHRHVHGANMGTRGDVYLAAGGWRRLPSGEDRDLWTRLGELGDCVSSNALAVRTSARTNGRAPAGFADDLARMTRSSDAAGAGRDARESASA